MHLLQRYFFCRTDRIAFFAPQNYPSPVEVNGQLEALLRAHLEGVKAPPVTLTYRDANGEKQATGRFRIGSYTPAPDGTTRWLCIDFDGGSHHGDTLADPLGTALATYRSFVEADLPVYLERSGSGQGWHLWCFFDPPVQARKARMLARILLPERVTLSTGEEAEREAGRGVEIFPKQERISPEGCGNLVWLPWWSQARGEANQFCRINGDEQPVSFFPEAFETVAEAPVDSVIASAGLAEDSRQLTEASGAKDDDDTSKHLWQEWRKQALAALPLESVYGKWLTGKTGARGWLECCDPWSPTGDRNPSAGVADGSGEAERGTFHSFISGKSRSVFDFLIERGEAEDFMSACTKVAEIAGIPLPNRQESWGRDPQSQARPIIQINNRQLRDVIADAWPALHAANQPPRLFQRAGSLVHLRHVERAAPYIEHLDEASIYGLLARAADWARMTEKGWVSVNPSREVARDMLVFPDEVLPAIEAVTAIPVFGENGSLISSAGYHAAERLWYHPLHNLKLENLPHEPTSAQIKGALELLLNELLVDFPFVQDSDRAHALAALLLPFVRRMIKGCTPIHLIEAPMAGTGKGLLCSLIAILTTGFNCDGRTLSGNEDEARKMITAELSKGRPLILLDNTKERRRLDCPPLASVITAQSWTDRLLGHSKMVTVPNNALWLITGNNPKLSIEIARRCVRIRLDARVDRPWRRGDFKHPNIIAWTREQCSRLIKALLILVQAWIAAGQPLQDTSLGSFEHWSAVIGGILQRAAIPGFLEHLEELYEAADEEGNEWREFVAAWWEAFKGEPKRAAELQELCEEQGLMLQTRGEGSQRSQQILLGKALQSMRDRIFEQWRIVTCKDPRGRNRLYALVLNEEESG
jgi:hypothetical protein